DAALGAGLCTGLDLALEVGTNVGAQLFDIAFGLTQLLGELGIELGQDAFGHFTHGDRELGGLAGDFLAAVVLGEAERERLRVTRLQTGDGRFEFGEHATLTQHEGEVLGLAAFELFAIDAADEIKRDTIAFGGRTVFARLVGGALTTQDIDRTFDVGIAHFAGAAGDFKCRQIGNVDFGIDLEGGRESELAVVNAFGLGLERWGSRHAQLCFAQHFFERATDFFVDDVVADAGPMAALNNGKRSLAWAKA